MCTFKKKRNSITTVHTNAANNIVECVLCNFFLLLFNSDFLSKGIYCQTSSEIDTILTLWRNKLNTHTTLLFVGIERNYR